MVELRDLQPQICSIQTACNNSDFGQSPSARDLVTNQKNGMLFKYTHRSFRFGDAFDEGGKVQMA
jgi:hypothetical protein